MYVCRTVKVETYGVISDDQLNCFQLLHHWVHRIIKYLRIRIFEIVVCDGGGGGTAGVGTKLC